MEEIQVRTCVRCRKRHKTRSGRGLCRGCWNDPSVRRLFPPVATFGGDEAGDIGHKVLREMRADCDHEDTERIDPLSVGCKDCGVVLTREE